jgi:hypothetical protein
VSYKSYAGWSIAHETAECLETATSRPVAAFMAAVDSHPSLGSWIAQTGRKLKATLHGVEWSGNENFYNMRELAPSLRFGVVDMFTLLPLGVLGMWLAWRRKIVHAPILIAVGFHVLLLVGICVTGRYRVPIAPLLLVYASAVLGAVLAPVIDRRAPSLPWVAACAVALLLGGSVMNHGRDDEFRISEYLVLYESKYVEDLNRAAAREDWRTCAAMLERFLSFMPRAFSDSGRDYRSARPSLKAALGFFAEQHSKLALVYEKTGDYDRARHARTKASDLKKSGELP